MIVPQITLDPEWDDAAIIAAVENHRTFGSVALKSDHSTEGRLIAPLKSVAGWVDIELQLPRADVQYALEYLNVGAMTILCDANEFSDWQHEIPSDRLKSISNQTTPSTRLFHSEANDSVCGRVYSKQHSRINRGSLAGKSD